MKRLFFITFIFQTSFFLPSLSAQQQAPKRLLFFEQEKYESLLALPPVNFPEGAFSKIHWVDLIYSHEKKKQDETPAITSNGAIFKKDNMNDIFFQAPTMKSADIFGKQAIEFGKLADETDDPKFKSEYRQLSASAYNASIAHLERQHAAERSMAAMEFGMSMGKLVLVGLKIWADNLTRKEREEIIPWGLADSGTLYSTDKDAPELFLTFIRENQPRKKQPYLFHIRLDAKVKFKDEIIALPS